MKLVNILAYFLCALPSFFQGTLAANYTNPLRGFNGGDPQVVFYQGWYYMMSTNFNDLRMTRARTLDGLKSGEEKLVFADSNASRCCNVWAPEMHFINNQWYIYYTAGPQQLATQRSHVVRGGATPWDAYSYLGTLRPESEWAIDGTILRLNNNLYFVYSGFQPNGKQSLYIALMTSPSTTGPSKLLSSPEALWETQGPNDIDVNEGPNALYRGGKTYIVFSGSYCWTPSYSLGYLTYRGGDPLEASSWTKTGPVFTSANGNFGPGHNSFFTSPDGKDIWNVYHATTDSNGNCGGNRQIHAKKMEWNADNTPNFGKPTPNGVSYRGPAGEPA